jgi:ATP-dependent Clp protease ATP-binding subunit ClpB
LKRNPDLSDRQQTQFSQWQKKQTLDAINALKEEEDHLRVQIDQAERAYDLNKAAQLKYGKLEALQRERKPRKPSFWKSKPRAKPCCGKRC